MAINVKRRLRGEQIQKAFPETRAVKALNTTMNWTVMVNPGLVNGDHNVFMSGNDPTARGAEVSKLLGEWCGWKPENIIDLGGSGYLLNDILKFTERLMWNYIDVCNSKSFVENV